MIRNGFNTSGPDYRRPAFMILGLLLLFFSCAADHPYREEMGRLEQHLDDAPDDARANRRMGELHYLTMDYQVALEYFEVAERLSPDDPVAQQYKGQTLLALGRCDEGLVAALGAERLKPGDPDILLLKGMSLFCRFALPEARKVFAGIIEQNPENAKAIYYLGRCDLARGDRTGALRQYTRLKALDAGLAERLFAEF